MKQNIKINLLPNNRQRDYVFKNSIIFILLFFTYINFQFICVPYLEYRDEYNNLKVSNNKIYIEYSNLISLLELYDIDDDLYYANVIVNDVEAKIVHIDEVRNSIYESMSSNNYITSFSYEWGENIITITLDLEYEREIEYLVDKLLEQDGVEKIEIGTIQEKTIDSTTRRIVTTLKIHLEGDEDE